MASYTEGTPSTIFSAAMKGSRIVRVNTNTFACLYNRDSDDYCELKTYSLTNGVWSYDQGKAPIFTGDAWYNAASNNKICKIDTDRVLFTYCDGSQYLRSRLVDASISLITDRGSKDLIGEAATWNDICQIDTDKAVAVYRRVADNQTYAVLITVAGNVQTSYTPVKLSTDTPLYLRCQKISSNKFAVMFDNNTQSKTTLIICTISGTTITPSTPVDISGETGNTFCDIVYMDDDKFVALWRTGTVGKACSVTVSGTIPTPGSVVTFDSTSPSNPCGIALNTTDMVIVYCQNAIDGRVIKGVVNWGTNVISFDPNYKWWDYLIGGGSTDHSVDICETQIVNEIAIIFEDGNSSNDYCVLQSLFSAISPPSNVVAAAGSKQGDVDISWDAVAGATSYNIYWGTSTGVTKLNGTKITGVTNPYIHEGLDLNQNYFYVVTTVIGASESDESSEVSSYPLDSGSVLSALGGDSSILLSWGDVDGANKYDLYYADEQGVTKVTGTKIENVTSIHEHICANGCMHYFICVVTIGSTEYTSNEVYGKPDFFGKIFDHTDQIKNSLLYQYMDKD